MQARHVIKELNDSEIWKEGKEGLEAIVAISLHSIGWGSSERLAKTLLTFFSEERSQAEKEALEKSYADIEDLRTQSVYVDVNEDLSLKSLPRQISADRVSSWIENAKHGLGVLSFLRSPDPDLRALVESMPKDIRGDVETQVKEMISKMGTAPTVNEVGGERGA